MEIIQHRGGLPHTLKAIEQGMVTLGFIGGSITDPRVEWNWPEAVCAWFVERYPRVRVVVENAAIGATGSDLAVLRAERDLIERGCDLVFIEFAVNDLGETSEQRMRTREGLVRKLLKGSGRDLVFTYTFSQAMYAEMIAGQAPASIAEFEALAEHYAIGSVWMGLHALREVQRGRMRWEEWLPDGLHPQHRGSLSYAQSVIAYLEKEFSQKAKFPTETPAALNVNNWENSYALSFAKVALEGPWTVRRWNKLAWIDQVLHTAAVGARLSFAFEGRGLSLGFDFGKSSSEFRYRLDGQEWQLSKRDRPDWCGADGWFKTYLVVDDLPHGVHTFELEVTHGDPTGAAGTVQYAGTNFNLALIGIVA